jgi:hypothetical protein
LTLRLPKSEAAKPKRISVKPTVEGEAHKHENGGGQKNGQSAS